MGVKSRYKHDNQSLKSVDCDKKQVTRHSNSLRFPINVMWVQTFPFQIEPARPSLNLKSQIRSANLFCFALIT